MGENQKMSQNQILALATPCVLRGVLQIGFECNLNTILKRNDPLSGKLNSLLSGFLIKEIP